MGNDPPGGDLTFSGSQKAAILDVIGAVSGSLAGALIGAAVEDERWDRVGALPEIPRLSVTPMNRHAVAIVATLPF
jgi:hypothetical protein